jgi:hypothetical protein
MQPSGSETSSTQETSPPATLTSDQSLTCSPATSSGISSAISSQESGDGRTLSDSPDGTTPGPSGPAPVHVSRFRALANDRDTPTRGTSGLLFIDLSPSAILQSSLESRLRARMGGNGSPEYVLTWKTWDMPAGAPICALRASARHTLGNGCIGWPTLIKRDGATLLRARRVPNATGSEPMAWVGGLVTGIVTENRAGLRMEVSVGLNPVWASWLMGFPAEWAQLAPLGTQSFRKSRPNLSSRQAR